MTYIKEALGVTKTPVPVVGHCMRPWLGAQEVEGGCSAASCSIPQLPFQLCITPGSGKVTGITYLLLSTAQFHLIGIHTLQKQEPAANIFSINQPNLCQFSWCPFPAPPQSRTSPLRGRRGAQMEQPQGQGQLGSKQGKELCLSTWSLYFIFNSTAIFSMPGSCEALLIHRLKSIFIQHSEHDCKWFIVVILLDYFNFRSTAFLLFIFPGNTHYFSSL